MTRLFTTKASFSVYRLTAESGSKEAYSGTANGTIRGMIMAISPEDTMLGVEGNVARAAILMTEVQSDVKVSDKITDADGNDFIVKAVKKPQRLFSVAYKRCVVERMGGGGVL